MKYMNFNRLSLSQVEIFMTAAKTKSFTTTAQTLNYTQSTISKTIATIERELGLILFKREKQKIALTPAGQSLYKDWSSIFAQFEDSVKKAHVIQTGILSSLSVGVCDSSTDSEKFESVILTFIERFKNVSLHYDEFYMSELLKLAASKALDIIITAHHDVLSLEECGYSWKYFSQSTLSVFALASSPLSAYEKLSVSDLKTEKFIAITPVQNPNYIRLLLDLCAQYDFTPTIATYVSNAHSYMLNVLKGEGIVLADTLTNISHKDIIEIPLEGLEANTVVAWPSDTTNANVERFLAIVEEINASA